MSNLLDKMNGLKTYGGGWNLLSTERFSNEDAKCYEGAEVVNSDFGLSVCFTLAGGAGYQYVPLGRDSQMTLGDKPQITDLNLLTLERDGEICLKVEEVQ